MVTLDQAGRGVSRTRVFAPRRRELRSLIELISVEWDDADSSATSWRIVPDPSPHLIFTLPRRPETHDPGLRLVGARSVHVDIDKSRRAATVAVRFRPGAAAALFRIAAAEFRDRAVSLDALGRWEREWSDRLMHASTPEEAARLLESCVAEAARRRHARVDWRVREVRRLVAQDRGALRVHEMADALGVPARTLRQVVRNEVGLGVRRFARIERVHRALTVALAASGRPPWSRVAQRTGFYDHAHLAREFRALLGEAPGAFMSRREPSA